MDQPDKAIQSLAVQLKPKQPFNTELRIYELARTARPELESIAKDVVKYAKGARQFIPKNKDVEDARNKVAGRGGPKKEWNEMYDIVRGSIYFEDLAKMASGLRWLNTSGVKRVKEKWFDPDYARGYADLQLILKVPCGMLVELQCHTEGWAKAKSEDPNLHVLYEIVRDPKNAKWNAREWPSTFQYTIKRLTSLAAAKSGEYVALRQKVRTLGISKVEKIFIKIWDAESSRDLSTQEKDTIERAMNLIYEGVKHEELKKAGYATFFGAKGEAHSAENEYDIQVDKLKQKIAN